MLVHFQGQTRNWQFYYLSRIEKRNISILPFLRLSPQILTIGGGNIPNDAIPSWKHEESTSVALLSPVCLFSILSIPTEGGTYPGWGCGLDMSNPPMKEAPVISNGWWGILNYVALSDCSWEKINYIKMYLIFQHFRSYFDVTRYNWITKPEVYILQMEQVYFPNFFFAHATMKTLKIWIPSPDPPNNYFLLHFWAVIFRKMKKMLNFCPKVGKICKGTGFLPKILQRYRFYSNPPPADE